MFLLFVHITPLFNRQECFISNGRPVSKLIITFFHATIWLKYC